MVIVANNWDIHPPPPPKPENTGRVPNITPFPLFQPFFSLWKELELERFQQRRL